MKRAAKEQAAVRQLKALDLRKAGLTYQAIGDRLGISRQAAHKLVKAAVDAVKADSAESASDLIAIESQRLDHMQVALWSSAMKGDPKSIDRILRIMERRARLLGLDAQVEQVAGSVTLTVEVPSPAKPGAD